MSYVAKAQVGGKLAQIGSRLVDGAAAKMADDFFARFVTRVAPALPRSTACGGRRRRACPTTMRTPIAPAGGAPWIRYAAIVAIVVVLIVLYARGYR